MNQEELVKVVIKGMMPTSSGCAVFLGPEEKTFVIYLDQHIGNTLSMTMNKVKKERPLTHDLIQLILRGLDAQITNVIINDVDDSGTFFARLMLKMENEVHKKFVEIDARPSDSMILALQEELDIYVTQSVLDRVDDMTEILERVLREEN